MAFYSSSIFSWDRLVQKFMVEIQTNKPEKLLELVSKITSDQSNEDIFSLIWSLEEAHNILSPKACLPNAIKSFTDAHRYRLMGDEHLKHQNFDKALTCYNASLMSAPHPPFVVTGSTSCVGAGSISGEENVCGGAKSCSGWGEFGALAQGYDARAHLLFKMKQYELCIRDIDLTFDLGCPQATHDNLARLRYTCLRRKVALKRGSQKSRVKDSFSYECPAPPTLDDPNPRLPSLSTAVQLAYTADQGRHVVATRDIHPGEIVGVEESYVCSVHADHTLSFCIVCLKRCSAPLPCHTCSKVAFCSDKCRREGMTDCHWQECPVLPVFHILDMGSDAPVRAYRLMMKVGYAAMKTLLPQLESEAASQPPETLGFNSEGVYDGSNYRSVFHLVTNKEKRPHSDLMRRCLQAFITTKLLEQSKRYFISSDGVAFSPSEEDFLVTGSTLLHHLMSFMCNTDSINEQKIITDDFTQNPIEAFGGGIFPTLSLFNHSCIQSCFKSSYGKMMVVRAARLIPAGVALTVSYGCVYDIHNMQSRREYLLHEFCFLCTCEACENNWPVVVPQDIKLKCIKCSQAVDPNMHSCLTCCIEYKKCMPVAGSLDLTTYDYTVQKKKITRALAKYKLARRNIMERGSRSEEDKKIVITMVELLSKYMVEPNVLSEAPCVLMSYYDRLAASVHVNQLFMPDCPIS